MKCSSFINLTQSMDALKREQNSSLLSEMEKPYYNIVHHTERCNTDVLTYVR